MSAEKVAVWLTKKETQLLRRLIVEEARREGLTNEYPSDRRLPKHQALRSVAKKIWDARQHFNGEG